MAEGQGSYRSFVTRELREAKPKTKAQAQQALKHAAAEWRAMRQGILPAYRNPMGSNILNLAVYAAIGYAAYKYLKGELKV